MKKYLSHIILGVIIVILAVAIGCLYFSDKKKTTENTNNPVETTEPVETSTPEPTATVEPTAEPEPTEEPTPEPTDEVVSIIDLTPEERAEARYQRMADQLGITVEEVKAMLAEAEASQNSPYMSDRHGFNVGDTTTLDNGITVAYQGEDIWKDVSSDTKYKTTQELENGGLWFEQQGTQQASGNPDSPYISDRYGHQVGSQMVIYDYITVTYQGEDIWMAENSNIYTVVKDHGNGYMEFSQGLFAKPGETPVSERMGYQPGDTIFCQSLGYSFNRVYVGNDIWYNDNEPDVELIASLQNGQLLFHEYTWK